VVVVWPCLSRHKGMSDVACRRCTREPAVQPSGALVACGRPLVAGCLAQCLAAPAAWQENGWFEGAPLLVFHQAYSWRIESGVEGLQWRLADCRLASWMYRSERCVLLGRQHGRMCFCVRWCLCVGVCTMGASTTIAEGSSWRLKCMWMCFACQLCSLAFLHERACLQKAL
jgi:hypothetical protein